MDKKPYIILLASQKGGVGKTTIAINLAVSLVYQDYEVLLVDTDAATVSISMHLGLKGDMNGYGEAVNGNVPVNDVIFAYQPLNLHLILGDSSDDAENPTPENLNKFYAQLVKLNYDFIIIDSPPGKFSSNVAKYINDVAIVTTPDMPSSASSAKLAANCDKYKIRYRLIVNRVGRNKFELEKEDVEKAFGDVAFAMLPEDKIVDESIAKHSPAYILDKGSPFSAAIEEFSRSYMIKVGEPSAEAEEQSQRKNIGFFGRLTKWAAKEPKK